MGSGKQVDYRAREGVDLKKTILPIAAIAFCLSLSQVCIASSQQAAEPNAVLNLDIRLDTFCDGISLSIDLCTGLVVGNATGCYSHHYLGTAGSVRNQGHSLTLTLSDDSDFPGIIYVIRQDGTWTNFYEEEGALLVANSGTWSLVTAATDYASEDAVGSAD
jgi:hypothetical protein